MMHHGFILAFIAAYFLLLLTVAWYTGRNAGNESYFIGNRNSNWILVSFGMIGTSLSGVTFISVPGGVAAGSFAYLQIAIGYVIGYLGIAYVLLPLYYKLGLTSIYSYLQKRFGVVAYRTGAIIFIVSRLLGATARLYLVVLVLHVNLLEKMGIPFWATTLVTLLMIMLYTLNGGVKTIVWTDTLQTLGMLGGLVACTTFILKSLHLGLLDSFTELDTHHYSKVFFTDYNSKQFFLKQILAGVCITLSMTGLDQEMMQKNISVKKLGDSRKNVIVLAVILLLVSFLFLYLGGLLYLFAEQHNILAKGDDLFPKVAFDYLPSTLLVVFILALISALFPSADGAITALTSSFCIDILGMRRHGNIESKGKENLRKWVHASFGLLFFVCVLFFKWLGQRSMIDVTISIATYTYGPLLGLFTFGIFTKRGLRPTLLPIACAIPPVLCYMIDLNQKQLFGSYGVGKEIIVLNAALTFFLLYLISYKKIPSTPNHNP